MTIWVGPRQNWDVRSWVILEVFRLVGVTEKILKREGPDWAMVLLGFLFNGRTGIVTIPPKKLEELFLLIQQALGKAEANQCM